MPLSYACSSKMFFAVVFVVVGLAAGCGNRGGSGSGTAELVDATDDAVEPDGGTGTDAGGPSGCDTEEGGCASGEVCVDGTCEPQPDDCRETPCKGFAYCDLNTGECREGCASDGQCGDQATCDIATHECVCEEGATRLDETCVSEEIDPETCASNHCGSGEYCDLEAGACREGCWGDAACGAEGACNAERTCECREGAKSCGGTCAACPSMAPANSHRACDGTTCVNACDDGYHECGGACVADDSTDHCGSRCDPCPTPDNGSATCDGSTCGTSCDSGYVSCSDGCCEHCKTAGCADDEFCDMTSGVCSSGCAEHAHCDRFKYCDANNDCIRGVRYGQQQFCPSGYEKHAVCPPTGVALCISKDVPTGSKLVDSGRSCPSGTVEQGTASCGDRDYKFCVTE